ncbi:unnamed protein product [Cochlearia groenlandica]
MNNTKLITLLLGIIVMMMMVIMNLPYALEDVGGSKYEGYGLMVSVSDEPLLLGRKLRSLIKPINSGLKKLPTKELTKRDSTKEMDNLMRSDYASRMKGRKRTPIHN